VLWADVAAAPFFAASGLLALAGLMKLRDPGPLVRVLRQARLPSSQPSVRIFGLIESMAGVAAFIRPGLVTGAAVAALYLGFSLFLLWLLVQQIPVTSCGCLGARETPPSVIHLALNACAATAAIAVAAGAEPSGIVPFVVDLSYRAIPFVIGLVAIAYAAYLAVAFLPNALSSYGRVAAGGAGGPERS
jgi:hypothetical protein